MQDFEYREMEKPTHKDPVKMIMDLFKFVKKHTGSKIIAADNPGSYLIGYLALLSDQQNNEKSKYFSVRIRDVRDSILLEHFDTAKKRRKLCNKKSIKNLLNLLDEEIKGVKNAKL